MLASRDVLRESLHVQRSGIHFKSRLGTEKRYLHARHKLCLYLTIITSVDPWDTVRKYQRDVELRRPPHLRGQQDMYVWCLRFEYVAI
jgi:hypothetical protein